MKYIFTCYFSLLLFFTGFTQNCTTLGCAANYGNQVVDATVPDEFADPNSCYVGLPYKQVFWQFFYSPSGGDYTQTFTPTSTGDPMDIDYNIFDMGVSGPASITCPVDISGFTEILCNLDYSGGNPTGPGIDGTATTIAGHFYAVAVYVWQGADPSYAFDIGDPMIDGLPLDALNCPGVLPVKLTSFQSRLENCKIQLDWATESETHFKHFEVQYSADGRQFHSIATLPAKATGSSTYQFIHDSPQPGNNYYRLKMTDLDAKYSYSKTQVLKYDCNNADIIVYPNPVVDVLNIKVKSSGIQNTEVTLSDNHGRIVYTGRLQSGSNSINLSGHSKGIYILRVAGNGSTRYYKIIR